MEDIMGIVYTGENDTRLRELTLSRAVAALPVVGRYRIIDFQVSNLVNSGAKNVGVITQRNYHSLMDHLGSGKEWDLHGKKDGLFILPPFLTRDNVGVYEGMLDALRSNIGYLRRSRQEYVIITDSHVIYNIDFQEMLACHISTGADITLLHHPTRKIPHGTHEYRVYFDMDDKNKVTKFEIDPVTPHYGHEYMQVLMARRELLYELVSQAASDGHHRFTRDVLQRSVNDGSLRIMGYQSPSRGWHIDSVQSYYRFNMDALDSQVRTELFHKDRPIYTKVRDDVPARYGENAKMSGSLIADGCRIDGTVENSVIFRGVTIAKGATVKNSIVMQDSVIEEGAEICNCVLDKQATIKRGGRLIGPETYPIVISKNVTI